MEINVKATLPKRDACLSQITMQPIILSRNNSLALYIRVKCLAQEHGKKSLRLAPNIKPHGHLHSMYEEMNSCGMSLNISAESIALLTSTSNKVEPYPGQLLSISMYCFCASSWSMLCKIKETRLASKVPLLFYASFTISFVRIWQFHNTKYWKTKMAHENTVSRICYLNGYALGFRP